jgi:3-oxoacyl-[acyl-carrier protein] reductase
MATTTRAALVTGSATGIGKAAALRFARLGFAVAVNYSKSEAEARETYDEVRALGVPALLLKCNVADEAAVRDMVEACRREWGGIDVLVNNAGMTRFVEHHDLAGLTGEIWDEIFAVNVKGTYFCCRAAIPVMQARGGGAIVNVTSVAGIVGLGSSMAYAASKAALNCLTKSLARAFGPTIRVNAVAPGPVLTRWLAGHRHRVEEFVKATPLGRAATPDDIADVIAFLATDAKLMTGQVVVVDGGRTM